MKNQKGITLISLAVTIVVFLILITTFSYNIDSYMENVKANNITTDLQKLTEAVENYYSENKELPILNKYINLINLQDVINNNDNENYYVIDLEKIGGIAYLDLNYGVEGYNEITKKDINEKITDITDVFIVNEQSHMIYYPKGVKSYDDVIYNLYNNISQTQAAIPDIKIDGSWNEKKKLNTPKLEGTGLTAIYWDKNGNEVELTSASKATDWSNWYDYENHKWANAVTKDENGNVTGYFVWIPRYAYKIKSGLSVTGATGEIEVVFVDINNKNGNTTYSEIYPTVEDDAMTDFVVHPAFTEKIENGGWDKDIEGFWIAKYAAGFQNATAGEQTREVQNSTLKYTELNGYTSNFLTSSLTTNTNLSYPVFKPNTYAYNIISVGDAFLLSQEIDGKSESAESIETANSFYGLNNVNSHLVKNSEWGAVAYLTHSKYGVNSNTTTTNEVTINSKNLNDKTNNVYAVTSYGNSDIPNDVNASSTKNMTGVFDLSGCIWERTAGYYKGGAASTPEWHNAMATSSTTTSTKYLTLYTANDKVGDANNETVGWNSNYSNFMSYSGPVLSRGGDWSNGEYAGVFAFYNDGGYASGSIGFRVCLTF